MDARNKRGHDHLKARSKNNVRPRRHQRVWPYRPQRPARHRRGQAQRHHRRRHQRSRSGRNQRAPAALRFRPWPLPRRGDGEGRHHRLRHRTDQGAGGARSGDTSVEGPRYRHRARMHRPLHLQGQGVRASEGRRQARAGVGARRRRRPHGGLRRQPREADQGPHGGLERVLHDQLPRAGGQGAQRLGRHRQGLHDHDSFLHRRPAHARHHAQGSLSRARRGART